MGYHPQVRTAYSLKSRYGKVRNEVCIEVASVIKLVIIHILKGNPAFILIHLVQRGDTSSFPYAIVILAPRSRGKP